MSCGDCPSGLYVNDGAKGCKGIAYLASGGCYQPGITPPKPQWIQDVRSLCKSTNKVRVGARLRRRVIVSVKVEFKGALMTRVEVKVRI